MNPPSTTNPPLTPPPTPEAPPPTPVVARRRSEYEAWWEAKSIIPWCAHIFRGPITEILNAGVSSFADFHRKLQAHLKMRIPEEQLREWLTEMGEPFATLFSRRTLIKLDAAAVQPPPTAMPVTPTAVPDDTPDPAEIQTTNSRPLVAGPRPPAPVIDLRSPGLGESGPG